MAKTRLALAGALGHLTADKRVEILRRVGAAGSISQAAREAGVSYKAAWQALDTLSNLAGVPLVERAVGGAGGGGARLTLAGEQLLRAADQLTQARDQVLGRLRSGPARAPQLAALSLRTSMRNQFPATVRAIRADAGAVRVELALAGEQLITSRITRESVQLLGLRAGLPVLALCKATAVTVAEKPQAGPHRNLLAGTVSRGTRAAAGGEVALTLEGGAQLVGFAEGPTRVGARVFAAVEAAAVVIALAG